MFFKRLILIFALGLLILGNSIAKSKTYNLELLDENPIDLCGKEFQKQVIIAPYMGAISKSDSLFGFEMVISYDPTIVQMNQKLFVNTIAQFFEYKDVKFDSERGEIIVDGLVSSSINTPPVAGDLPLIAFGGDFIGKCDEVAKFKIKYIYPIDGFKGNIENSSTDLDIVGKIVDKPTRELSYSFDSNKMSLKKDSTIEIPVNLNLGEMNNLDYWKAKISIDIDSVSISSIKGNSSVVIDSVTKTEKNNYIVVFKVLDNTKPQLIIDVSSFKYDSSVINIDFETIETSECVCATRFPSNNFTVNNLQSKSGEVESSVKYNPEYEIVNNMIIPRTESLLIQVYNINGMELDNKKCNVNQVYNLNDYNLGIYFIKITSKTNSKLIKIINN